MMIRQQPRGIYSILWTALVIGVTSTRIGAAEPVDFNRDVRPILSDHCYACHGPDAGQRKADLRLDMKEDALAPREGTPAIVPGKPDESELIRRIFATDTDVMPPAHVKKTLDETQRQTLRRWIEEGANWADHWAYVPPVKHSLPDVHRPEIADVPMDRFILAKLDSRSIDPSPEADRRTLIRRVSFDVVGMPPLSDDVQAFVEDASPDAWERVVDRLLASPHFGERMAISWLDLVRYADTVGYHGDQPVKVSPYRDYIIDAFNANMPFDRFTREQLAGDLLPEPTTEQKIASAYNRLGMMSAEGGAQPKEYLAKYAADRVRTAGSVWLGSTIGCAECHDHKFDPFTLNDFYQFASFFADIQERGVYGGNNFGTDLLLPGEKMAERVAPIDAQLTEVKAKLDQLPKDAPKEEREPIQKEFDNLNKKRQQVVEANSRSCLITVSTSPREMRVLPRGDWMNDSGPVVTPAVPHFLPQLDKAERLTRLDLADWLTAKENPLTARVFVNRIWKLAFGTGLSRVLDDVGAQGEAPTHPELLDTLAVEFMDDGWDVKNLFRGLVLSRTYRQSSLPRTDLDEIDPKNRLLARQSRWRLDAEMIRDSGLSVSGLLVRQLGGDSVKPYQPPGLYRHLNFPRREYVADAGEKQYRRGVYTHWQRQYLHPAMKAFDAPPREECAADRPRSNTPLGALVLLNDPSYVEMARVLAERVMREGGTTDVERVRWLVGETLARPARDAEVELLVGLLTDQGNSYRDDPNAVGNVLKVGLKPVDASLSASELAGWTAVCRTVLNLNETITRN